MHNLKPIPAALAAFDAYCEVHAYHARQNRHSAAIRASRDLPGYLLARRVALVAASQPTSRHDRPASLLSDQPRAVLQPLTADALQRIGGRMWEGRQGQRRVYFNQLPAHFGLLLEIEGGSVHGATLNGAPMNGYAAASLHGVLTDGKVWYDLDSRSWQHKIGSCPGYDGRDTGDAIVSTLRRKLIAEGVAA